MYLCSIFLRFPKEFIPRIHTKQSGPLVHCTHHVMSKKNLLSFEEINHAPNYPLYLPSIIISVAVAAVMYNNQM